MLYADFAKHAGKENAMHIERVWNSVPNQLASSQDASAGRFRFSGVVPGIDRYRDLAGAIDWLIAAGLVLPAAITNHAAIPLSAFCKPSLFKLYCCDIGLLGAMANLSPQALLQQEYGSYKGYFAENFVAQEFSSHSDEKLVCWQQEKSEIEFVHSKDTAVIPIEVKSGRISKAKSLDKFIQLYQPPFGVILSGAQLDLNPATAWFTRIEPTRHCEQREAVQYSWISASPSAPRKDGSIRVNYAVIKFDTILFILLVGYKLETF